MTTNARKIIEDAKVLAQVEATLAERAGRDAARQLCQGVYRNGNLCRSYAIADGLCRRHGGDMTAAEREADAARVRENEEVAARLFERQRQAADERRANDCTYRGFRIVNRGSARRPQYQVNAISLDSAVAYLSATGGHILPPEMAGLMRDTDCGLYEGVTVDELKRQIDDILAGEPPVEVYAEKEYGAASARIVSLRTGEVYGELSAHELAQRDERNARVEALRQAATVGLYGAGMNPLSGMNAAEIMAVVNVEREKRAAAPRVRQERQAAEAREREARISLLEEERKLMAERRRAEAEATERESSRNRRKQLAELHQRQDIEGLQHTDLDGKLLCDSCQRVYHDSAYDFCYGCKRGRKRTDHLRRIESGEIAKRKEARQAIRERILAPMREVEAAEKEALAARQRSTSEEIAEMLQRVGLTGWTFGDLAEWVERVDYEKARRLDAYGCDAGHIMAAVEAVESLSPEARERIGRAQRLHRMREWARAQGVQPCQG